MLDPPATLSTPIQVVKLHTPASINVLPRAADIKELNSTVLETAVPLRVCSAVVTGIVASVNIGTTLFADTAVILGVAL